MSNDQTDYFYNIALLTIIAVLAVVNTDLAKPVIQEHPHNIVLTNDAVDFSTLTLKQKISQKLLVSENKNNKYFYQDFLMGGIILSGKQNKFIYDATKKEYQSSAEIPFLFATKLDGCKNPFSEFSSFKTFNELKSVNDVKELAEEHAAILNDLGLSISIAEFAPIDEKVYRCNVFFGNNEDIAIAKTTYMTTLHEKEVCIGDIKDNNLLSIAPEFSIDTFSQYDMIPLFIGDQDEIHKIIISIENAVISGKIKESDIDTSVKKILKKKGFLQLT